MKTIVRRSGRSVLEVQRELVQPASWHSHARTWTPPTDLYETEQAFVIRVEVAGMRATDFEVAFENRVLLIMGSRSDVLERRAYHQMEIRFGRFATSVGVPSPVDIEGASAEYEDGFLTVLLPKPQSNTIKVG
jgi:HSP20 family protein